MGDIARTLAERWQFLTIPVISKKTFGMVVDPATPKLPADVPDGDSTRFVVAQFRRTVVPPHIHILFPQEGESSGIDNIRVSAALAVENLSGHILIVKRNQNSPAFPGACSLPSTSLKMALYGNESGDISILQHLRDGVARQLEYCGMETTTDGLELVAIRVSENQNAVPTRYIHILYLFHKRISRSVVPRAQLALGNRPTREFKYTEASFKSIREAVVLIQSSPLLGDCLPAYLSHLKLISKLPLKSNY